LQPRGRSDALLRARDNLRKRYLLQAMLVPGSPIVGTTGRTVVGTNWAGGEEPLNVP
jgi:hypothetical protein